MIRPAEAPAPSCASGDRYEWIPAVIPELRARQTAGTGGDESGR